jgi:hypothetical protein
MAKMFYTLEETASKLGVSEDAVKQMVARGELQEFRDRDRLMFKVEQVDIKASGKEGGDDFIPLAESGELEPLTLASSGSGAALKPGAGGAGAGADNPKDQTGISIFEAESTEDADPSAVTRVTPSLAGATAPGGSAMMDLTRSDSADSAIAQDLLKDVYAGDQAGGSAVGVGGTAMGAGTEGLFEGTPSAVDAAAVASPAALLAAYAEPYDGAGSGLVGGLAFGMVVALLIAIASAMFGLTGASGLLAPFGQNMWAFVGAAAGIIIVGGVVGWVLGRRS